jgi:NTE family protein
VTLVLALGSGGARGWCHLGVLLQLKDIGNQPDAVAGCSMGALVGAAWAADRLNALEDYARGLTMQSVLGQCDLRLSGGGIMQGRGLTDMLRHIGVPETFDALPKPLLVVATDLQTGREVWMRSGSVYDAVRGSIGIPGLLSPHRHRGRWLVDGGLTNPVPVSACRALDADRTIAVNPNAKCGRKLWEPDASAGTMKGAVLESGLLEHLPDKVRGFVSANLHREESPNYLDVVSVSMDIMTDFLRQTRHAIDPPDILLDADLNHILALELFRAGEAIDEGRRLVAAARTAILDLMADEESGRTDTQQHSRQDPMSG